MIVYVVTNISYWTSLDGASVKTVFGVHKTKKGAEDFIKEHPLWFEGIADIEEFELQQ